MATDGGPARRLDAGLGWWAVAAYGWGLPAPAMALAAYPVAAWSAGKGGRLAGRAFAASTAGNVAGGLATGLVLQDLLGAGGAGALCVAAIGAGGWLTARDAGVWRAWPVATGVLGVVAGGGWFAPSTFERSAYGDYAVVERPPGTWTLETAHSLRRRRDARQAPRDRRG